MTAFPAELVAALNEGDALQKKGRLRGLVDGHIRSIPLDTLKASLSCNARVQNQSFNPRPTYSGIRDSLTNDAMIAIAAGMQTTDMTIEAIETEPFGQFGLAVDPVDLAQAVANGAATTVSATTGAPPQMTAATSIDLSKIDAAFFSVIDTMLASKGAPTFTTITQHIGQLEQQLKNKPQGLSLTYSVQSNVQGNQQQGIPAGSMTQAKANVVFNVSAAAAQFDFDVPVFDWASPHPMVPEVDPDYQFEPISLLRALWGLCTGQKMWLHGETGTGKTTLIEQIAARLQWPVARVNFDSEITRMDLIGRDTLVQENGATVTRFVDGILPAAMQMPCIFLCDELDFIRSDVSYVLQRSLESKGLLITEDGGRLIQPDPMFRIVATANTRGQGDDTGRYMGARPQSAALLDRFTCWIRVDYMKPAALAKLLQSKLPHVKPAQVNRMVKYASEHWHGFTNRDILQPLSPRGLVSAGEAFTFLSALMPEDEAMKQAIATTISERANETDAQTIAGIVQRVFK